MLCLSEVSIGFGIKDSRKANKFYDAIQVQLHSRGSKEEKDCPPMRLKQIEDVVLKIRAQL